MKRYISYILMLCLFPIFWGACDDSDVKEVAGGKITAAFGTLHLKAFENVTPLLVPVVLSQPAVNDMKVNVEVKSEAGAIEEVHYSFLSKSIVIAKGSSVGYFEVNLMDDLEVNPDRDFYVELLSVEGAAVVEGKDVCRITIQSDEGFPTIEFEKTLVSIGEDEGELVLKVNLTRIFDRDVAFKVKPGNASALEGVHFILPRTEFTIPAGNTVVNIPVTIVDDIDINDNRAFHMELTEPVNAVVSGSYGACKVTIVNDDTPVYVSFAEQERKALESDKFIYIPVKVEGVAKKPITLKVKVKEENQTDLDLQGGLITLPVGVTSDSIKILLNDNDIVDKNRKYTLYLDEIANAEKAEVDTTMVLNIINDDFDFTKLYDELMGEYTLTTSDKTLTVQVSGGNTMEEQDRNYLNRLIITVKGLGNSGETANIAIDYDVKTGQMSVPMFQAVMVDISPSHWAGKPYGHHMDNVFFLYQGGYLSTEKVDLIWDKAYTSCSWKTDGATIRGALCPTGTIDREAVNIYDITMANIVMKRNNK